MIIAGPPVRAAAPMNRGSGFPATIRRIHTNVATYSAEQADQEQLAERGAVRGDVAAGQPQHDQHADGDQR